MKNENITEIDIQKNLREVLPKYMLPTVYYCMDELRRNINGKIDRLLLSNKVNEER